MSKVPQANCIVTVSVAILCWKNVCSRASGDIVEKSKTRFQVAALKC
jgi:predicted nucleic acid-binding Zn ribbon protein